MSVSNAERKQLRVMLVDDKPDRRDFLEAALNEVGCRLVECASLEHDLLPAIVRSNPDVILIDINSPGRDTLESLKSVRSRLPRPMVMFTQDDDGETIRRAIRAGVTAYVVDGIENRRMRPIMDAAIVRFDEFQALEEALTKAQSALSDRKLVDKAKGILMQQRNMTESQAYTAMRRLAMDSNKKLVDIAESIVAAAKLLV